MLQIVAAGRSNPEIASVLSRMTASTSTTASKSRLVRMSALTACRTDYSSSAQRNQLCSSCVALMIYCHRSGGGGVMGASAWHYVVGYQPDVRQAFMELQETVLSGGSYYHGLRDRLTFASMAELNEARNTEAFWDEGTHSILDMMTFSAPDGRDDIAVVRLLRDEEVRVSFGHDQPTGADFERFIAGDWMVNRWEGRATVLYRAGNPDSLAFWGISGD